MAVIDRITLQFRDDEIIDITLSKIFSDLTPKRNRAFKAKELLVDYFKKEMPELYSEFYKKAEAELKERESNGHSTIPSSTPAPKVDSTPVLHITSPDNESAITQESNIEESHDVDESIKVEDNKQIVSDVEHEEPKNQNDNNNEVVFDIDFPM